MEGFSRLNKASDRFEIMPFNAALANADERTAEQLHDSIIWGYCEDKNNDLWIGTHYAGINRYDAQQKRFTKYNTAAAAGGLANNIAWTCFEDNQGRFWVGTSDGLSRMDGQTGMFKNYRHEQGNINSLRSGSVLDIYQDSKNRLWFATNDGLHLYRENSDDFEIYTADNGFINSGIRALTGDKQGNLWLGTNNGIVRFNPDTLDVKNYLYFAGKKCGAVNTGAAMTSSAGEVIFGTTDGLIIIDVEKLTTNQQQSPVILTDFKVFAKSVGVAEPGSVLRKDINNTDKIVLDHTKKMVSFEFALLNYRSAYKNTYAYMLEGFDRGWREVGNTREAQYTNLSPGTYTFKVRAANNDGVWTTQAKSIVIEQLPPPWKTWWAYTLYTALCGVCIGYFVFLQKLKQRKVEEQNRLLEFKVEERTRDLAEKNKDIQTLLANMRQGLLAIEEGGIIHHEYSTHLESIFETQTIAGQDVIDFLFKRALLDEDVISQMRSSINSMIGEDAMNYAMNAHILIREYQLRVADKIKTLSLDWSPILDGQDNVVRLMVSIRDSTELKALEHEAGVNKRELAIIGQLLPVSRKQFIDFARSTQRYVNEGLKLIEVSTIIDVPLLNRLFRNLHTVKGNSRVHNFSYIANAAHEAEAYLEQARSSPGGVPRQKLTEIIGQVGAILNEHEVVFRNLMVRNGNETIRADGVWISRVEIAEIKTSAERIKDVVPEYSQSIISIIEKSSAAPLVDIIGPTLESLPTIAHSLGKPAPKVIMNDAGILFKEAVQEPLSAVFTHLLRNALDHGIETAAVRAAAHKDPVGTINIEVNKTSDQVCIQLRDDGRGLDLNRLYQKGLEMGLFDRVAVISQIKVASSIFISGISTKLIPDDISGRGVGMVAVKQFLLAIGGDISVELLEPGADELTVLQPEAVSCTFKLRLPLSCCL
jgi:streptogramin lyase